MEINENLVEGTGSYPPWPLRRTTALLKYIKQPGHGAPYRKERDGKLRDLPGLIRIKDKMLPKPH